MVNKNASAISYTTIEALELMSKGKRITHYSWREDHYLFMNKCGQIMTSIGTVYDESAKSFLEDDDLFWNQYEPKEDVSTSVQADELTSGPCCKCGSPDPYNSKGKDGNWYCYVHCDY